MAERPVWLKCGSEMEKMNFERGAVGISAREGESLSRRITGGSQEERRVRERVKRFVCGSVFSASPPSHTLLSDYKLDKVGNRLFTINVALPAKSVESATSNSVGFPSRSQSRPSGFGIHSISTAASRECIASYCT